MKLRSFILLLVLTITANAMDLQWSSVPTSSLSGSSYYVEACDNNNSGSVSITVYKNGSYFASGYGFAGNTTSDTGAQTVNYYAEAYDNDTGESASISCSVQITVPNQAPYGCFDGLSSAAVMRGTSVNAGGWALDYEQGAPVSEVRILIGGTQVGLATLNVSRPDVQSVNSWIVWSPLDVTNSGWNYTINTSTLSQGSHTIEAVAVDNQGLTYNMGSFSLAVDIDDPPRICFDGLNVSSAVKGQTIDASGWALDQEQGAPVSRVKVNIDGAYFADATTGGVRPDVQSVSVSQGWSACDVTNSGWNYTINTTSLAVGAHTISVTAVDNANQSTDSGSWTFQVEALPSTYSVTVVGGSANPSQGIAGAVVVVSANTQSGYVFSSWSLTSGNGTIESAGNSTTNFTIGTANATLTANYNRVYTVTVNDGTASQSQGLQGAQITITAASKSGYSFSYWSCDSGDAGITSTTSSTTTITIGTADVTVTAHYTQNPVLTLPAFSTQPSSQSVTEYSNVTFSAVATGNPTPTYQWKKDGVAISNATSTSLQLNLVMTSNAGSYTVVASNSLGSVESVAAVLAVSLLDSAADNDGDGVENGLEKLLGLNPLDPSDAFVLRPTHDKTNQLKGAAGGTYTLDAEGNIKEVR